jgi:glycosyltransferase involved in cell wall biosynthesis
VTFSDPLRLAILHFTAPPVVGGVEAIVGHQARFLADLGHHVVVLAGRAGRIRSDVQVVQIPALDSKYPPLLQRNSELLEGRVTPDFESQARALELVLAPILADLDVCVVHNALTLHFNLPLTVALHRLAESSGLARFVAWCHDLSWSNPLYAPLVREAYPWSLLKVPAAETQYVVVSADRRADLARLGGLDPAEIAVVPAGVHLADKLGLGRAVQRLLAEYGLIEAEPFLLLPVRITRRKNIEYAIRVTAELRGLGFRPRLLVTGPRGPHDPASIRYVRELEALIGELHASKEVILLQAQAGPGGRRWRPSDAMMDQLYRSADLLLMPSAQEGFGIPILEAGLVGLPVFCSDIPPFRETAGKRARYFGLQDPPLEVASRIAMFLRDDARYGLRKRVQREFSWEMIFNRQVVPLLYAAATRRESDSRATLREVALAHETGVVRR